MEVFVGPGNDGPARTRAPDPRCPPRWSRIRWRATRRSGASAVLVVDDIPGPRELVAGAGTPSTVAGWKALADGLLTTHTCAFHRNVEISARYAWMYGLLPVCLKWAGMAALASHHVRLALYPLRLVTDCRGNLDIPRALGSPKVFLLADVNTIRETNNGIFDDIFWVHLAYTAADDGIRCLRALLGSEPEYDTVLSGFELIDRGRRVLEDPASSPDERAAADELVWEGNLRLLEHEQRALVQPHFDGLSCRFARLASMGSATSFEVSGLRHELRYFTSFYLSSAPRGSPTAARARGWPRITEFDDRWRWLESSVVPRFRRLDANASLFDLSLRRIREESHYYAVNPCVLRD